MKAIICDAPVLLARCMGKSFKLQVDVSLVVADWVLLQEDDFDFSSKKFNRHHLNHSVVEK